MKERRAHPRVQEEDCVAIKILVAEETPEIVGKTFFCTTEDLSVGGVRFCVHMDIPAKAVVELRVALNEPNRAFNHVGMVMWTKEIEDARSYVIGVKFAHILGEDDSAWGDIITMKLASLPHV